MCWRIVGLVVVGWQQAASCSSRSRELATAPLTMTTLVRAGECRMLLVQRWAALPQPGCPGFASFRLDANLGSRSLARSSDPASVNAALVRALKDVVVPLIVARAAATLVGEVALGIADGVVERDDVPLTLHNDADAVLFGNIAEHVVAG